MYDIYERAVIALESLLTYVDPPAANCSCHLSSPCNDCLDYNDQREALAFAQDVIHELRAYSLITK